MGVHSCQEPPSSKGSEPTEALRTRKVFSKISSLASYPFDMRDFMTAYGILGTREVSEDAKKALCGTDKKKEYYVVAQSYTRQALDARRRYVNSTIHTSCNQPGSAVLSHSDTGARETKRAI